MQSVAPRPSAQLIAVVEDEPVTRELLAASLRAAGFEVASLDGALALRAFAELARVDLVLLDIELPDGDGYDLATWLRAHSAAGIIFVSRRGAPTDRVRGLELGGDDFIVKPPDLDELRARVRAVLRRRERAPGAGASPEPTRVVRFDGWRFELTRYALTSPAGADVPLTTGEASVLAAILHARGRVVTHEELRDAAARAQAPAHARSVAVLVHRLRRKLGEGGAIVPRLLLTVHGIGYRLGVALEDASS